MYLLLIWFYAGLFKSPVEVTTWLWETGSVLTMTMPPPEHSQHCSEKDVPQGWKLMLCIAYTVQLGLCFSHMLSFHLNSNRITHLLWRQAFCLDLPWGADWKAHLNLVRISLFIYFCLISCVDMDCSWVWRKWP